jgi:hypothetical protein
LGDLEVGVIDREAGHKHNFVSARWCPEYCCNHVLGGKVNYQYHSPNLRVTVDWFEKHLEGLVRKVFFDVGGNSSFHMNEGDQSGVGLGYIYNLEHEGGGAVGGAGQADPLVRIIGSRAGAEAGALEQDEPVKT